MKSTYLLLLASLTVGNLTGSRGQGMPEDGTVDHITIDDIILQRAETILLRSILEKMQEDGDTKGVSSQLDCLVKRLHPPRQTEDLEKRQHPGRREEEEDDEEQQEVEEEQEEVGGEDYEAVEKRQHPGKRDDDDEDPDSFLQYQKRQHPGRRAAGLEPTLGQLSKRQHPGKRLLMLFSKRQHPGKRGDEAVLRQLVRRQHPGKRFWETPSPDSGPDSGPPCDALYPSSGCSQTSLLLDLLDNVAKGGRVEEKRQHPGKRLAPPEEDLVEK
ncbi:unnamed protein product [Merluccius merluccius]